MCKWSIVLQLDVMKLKIAYKLQRQLEKGAQSGWDYIMQCYPFGGHDQTVGRPRYPLALPVGGEVCE
jgi:hypothetical protein